MNTLAKKVSPAHAALLVVDMQNDFCSSDGACAKQGKDVSAIQAMVPRLVNLIEAARNAGVPVIFIRNVHNHWTDSPARRQRREDIGSSGTLICWGEGFGSEFFGVSPEPDDYIVTKHRFSAFVDTDLDLVLRSRQIRTLILTGVKTNVCVESTARDGHMRDYNIVLVDDCCTANNTEEHQATLVNIRNYFGVVASSLEIASTW